MHALVCIKEVLDPEITPAQFRVNAQTRKAEVPGAALVTSIFDINALETALKLRDAAGAGTVTVLSLGARSAETILRKALGCSANAAVLVSDEAFAELDPAGVATVIAAAVKKLERDGKPVDIVMTGRQAADFEHGQTGGLLAEALGWPCLTFISKVKPMPGGLEARREIEDGHLLIHAKTPLVLTITNDETNQPRLPKVRDVMMANRAKIPVWGCAELDLDGAKLAPRVRASSLAVAQRDSHCEVVEGESAQAKAVALADRLRELKIV